MMVGNFNYISYCKYHITAITMDTATLLSPITLSYKIQCQTNTIPDSLNITFDSVTYNVAQPSLNNNVTVNGQSDVVECVWSVNGRDFTNQTMLRGKYIW